MAFNFWDNAPKLTNEQKRVQRERARELEAKAREFEQHQINLMALLNANK